MKDGNHQLAEEYLRKAVSLEPNDAEPYLNLSALLRSQRKFQEAERSLKYPYKKR
jgi:Flp pilus assembly protein TadD